MSSPEAQQPCPQVDLVGVYALQALAPDEAAIMRVHLADCAECQRELDAVRP